MLNLRQVTQLVFILSVLGFQNDSRAQQNVCTEGHPSATLRVKFLFSGKPPLQDAIDGSSDPVCSNCRIPNERLLIGTNGELENVALIWDERKNKEHLPRDFSKPAAARIEIEHKSCRIHPHVSITRVGQEVVVVNRDNTGHGANFSFFNNMPNGMLVPVGKPIIQKLDKSEPAPISIQCNVHPWERAYLIVKDHPFVGISNANGLIEIPGLPVGMNSFKIWHEASAKLFEYVDLNGTKSPITKGLIQFKLNAGLNDLGVIRLDESQFQFEIDPHKK